MVTTLECWREMVHARIEANNSWVCIITGPTGSGKSWAALRFAHELDPTFTGDRIAFNVGDFIKLINHGNLEPGSVLILEEAGVAASSRNALSALNKAFGYLMQTVRSRRLIFLFTLPNLSFLEKQGRTLAHAHFQTHEVLRGRGLSRLKCKQIRHDDTTGKTYMSFLRMKVGKGYRAFPYIELRRPKKKLVQEYEAKKLEYTTDLYKEMETQFDTAHKNKRPMTPRQKAVYDAIEKSPTSLQKEIGEQLGLDSSQISQAIKGFRAKGWKLKTEG